MFFETEINFGGEGGLYAELVRNRDFEALGRGNLGDDADAEPIPMDLKREEVSEVLYKRIVSRRNLQPEDSLGLDPNEPPAVNASYKPWVAEGTDVSVSIATGDAPFPTNPHVLSVQTTYPFSGVSNPGYWGMGLRPGGVYNLSLYSKAVTASPVLSVALHCGGSEAADTLLVAVKLLPTANWQKMTVQMTVPTAVVPGCDYATSSLQVLAESQATFLLDHVSLFPADAALGIFRKDLFDLLKEFAPPQLRIPGGNYMEGTGNRTRWNWQNTIGESQARPGHYNTAWQYWVTDGIGLPEMLKLCEAIGAEPLLAVYTGYTLAGRYEPIADSQWIVDAAEALVEYVNGSTSTTWGARRLSDGIPNGVTPYALEVGNEEAHMGVEGYPGHYQIITQALWGANPTLRIVASGYLALQNRPNRTSQCFPCVGGCGMDAQRCDSWDEHTYDNNGGMAALYDAYDNYLDPAVCHTLNNTRCPDVNVLEYACRQYQNVECALAEASFLLGLERNGNFVTATAYAPLFTNIHGQQWGQDLINFDTVGSFALPSYYLQKMLKGYGQGATILKSEAAGNVTGTTWNASVTRTTSATNIKILNYGDIPLNVSVSFVETPVLKINTAAEILSGGTQGKGKQNTLIDPTAVVAESFNATIVSDGDTQTVTIPPNSVVVLSA